MSAELEAHLESLKAELARLEQALAEKRAGLGGEGGRALRAELAELERQVTAMTATIEEMVADERLVLRELEGLRRDTEGAEAHAKELARADA